MASSSPWRIDAGLARDLAAAIGWEPDDGTVALVGALADNVPAGSLAKRAALAAGEVPPGADPEAIARRIAADRAGGRPTPSWSCWPLCTVMAALAHTLRDDPTVVAATRRIDEGAPAVDMHSVVVADGLVCDPYFASVVPAAGADETVGVHRGVWCERTDEADGRWSLRVGSGRWSRRLAFRVLAPVLDRDDVRALCAVSATHSGAPRLPTAGLWRAERATDVWEHADGGAAVREWVRAGPDAVWEGTEHRTEHASWAEAAANFGSRTGVALSGPGRG